MTVEQSTPWPLAPSGQQLRVAVVGAGLMGADHVERLAHRILRARVTAVVDLDPGRAAAAAEMASGAECFTDVESMTEARAADAVVLATPGFLHEQALLTLLDAGLPVMCEKPLTPDPESAMRVVEAELAMGRRLIQVGFMRRFDAGYVELKRIIDSGEYGELLMLHHQHRNMATPATFTDEMVIHDSAVHEFDAVRFFTGDEITDVHVRCGRRSRHATELVHDPQHVVVQTAGGLLADVELFVNAQLGYQVHTQATFERGVVRIGENSLAQVSSETCTGSEIDHAFHSRFLTAYDAEVQQWVDSVLQGSATGPSAWDGYAAAAVCAAGVTSQQDGTPQAVALRSTPDLYR